MTVTCNSYYDIDETKLLVLTVAFQRNTRRLFPPSGTIIYPTLLFTISIPRSKDQNYSNKKNLDGIVRGTCM